MTSNQPHVVVQVSGGLGNQLFQYAMGRRLALANDVPLVLDHLSGFRRDFYRRKFALDRFNIQCRFVAEDESYANLRGRFRRRFHRRLNQNRPLERRNYVQEFDEKVFDPRLLNLRINRRVFFEGVWQHEEYFRDQAEQIRADLQLIVPHDPENVELARRICSVEAVCVHVRRLHGVSNIPNAAPRTENDNLHVAANYYQRALDHILQHVRHPRIFVFADFPEWAKQNLKASVPLEFVTHNGPSKDFEDFWLMTKCRHFVIANSTFSWWAAWLADYAEKLVVAPKAALGRLLQSVPQSWLAL